MLNVKKLATPFSLKKKSVSWPIQALQEVKSLLLATLDFNQNTCQEVVLKTFSEQKNSSQVKITCSNGSGEAL